LAALKTQPAQPPVSMTSRAIPARGSDAGRGRRIPASRSAPGRCRATGRSRRSGPVQRIADGMAHVRRAQMRHQRPVAEADQRVNEAFGMDHGLDLLGIDAEKLLGFNKLQRLVEHRRAVDGDPLAHVPVGMRARVCHRRLWQRLQRPVAQAAARGGDDDPLDRASISSPTRPGRSRNARCRPAGSRAVGRASAIRSGPAVTRLSLLASASVVPWRSALNPGASPAAPTMADMIQSAGRSAASISAASPAAASTPDPASASRRSAAGPRRR
jgi:hypothetical protein